MAPETQENVERATKYMTELLNFYPKKTLGSEFDLATDCAYGLMPQLVDRETDWEVPKWVISLGQKLWREHHERFFLCVQYQPGITLDDNFQLTVPAEIPTALIAAGKVAKEIDVLEHPFVLISSASWNAFQQTMDRLGVRAEFQKHSAVCLMIPKKNIVRK